MLSSMPTADNPQQFSEHGTRQAYDKGFCRCPDCQRWKRGENARKYAKRKRRLARERTERAARDARIARGQPARPEPKLNRRQRALERAARRAAGEKEDA